MSSLKHPLAKKEQRLRKDHRVFIWEGNKTFRGIWRKKKRRLGKKERRAAGTVLNKAESGAADEADSPKRQIPRKLHKSGVVTLQRALDIRERDRMKRFATFSYSSRKFEKA